MMSNFLLKYITRQIDNFFPSVDAENYLDEYSFEIAVKKTNQCLSKVVACEGHNFDYLNSGQYATLLYYLSNSIWKNRRNTQLATKIFLLNKALNGIDLFYEVEMPDFFLVSHTVGMVFSKATYGDYCVFHQGCTVGRNKSDRPILENGIVLYPNSSVIGACHVRENTVISPGVQLINTDTPGNCLVFSGDRGKPIFKEIKEYFVTRYYNI